jgi:uncharacterized membrane protein
VELLHLLVQGVNAQRPGHSFFVGGVQLPLEARMGGLFMGFLVAVLVVLLAGRARAALIPPWPASGVLAAFVGALALDGVNAAAYDRGLLLFYAPDNGLRLATGLLAGLAVGAFAWPALASRLWREPEADAPFTSAEELGFGLALLGAVYLAIQVDLAALLWPLALLGVAGVLVSFSVANAFLALALGGATRAEGWREAALPLSVGLSLTIIELVALAALRGWAETSLGVRWL